MARVMTDLYNGERVKSQKLQVDLASVCPPAVFCFWLDEKLSLMIYLFCNDCETDQRKLIGYGHHPFMQLKTFFCPYEVSVW